MRLCLVGSLAVVLLGLTCCRSEATPNAAPTVTPSSGEFRDTISFLIKPDVAGGVGAIDVDSTYRLDVTFPDGRVFVCSASAERGTLVSSVAKEVTKKFRSAGLEVSSIPEVGAVRVYLPACKNHGAEVPTACQIVVGRGRREDAQATIDSR